MYFICQQFNECIDFRNGNYSNKHSVKPKKIFCLVKIHKPGWKLHAPGKNAITVLNFPKIARITKLSYELWLDGFKPMLKIQIRNQKIFDPNVSLFIRGPSHSRLFTQTINLNLASGKKYEKTRINLLKFKCINVCD